MRRHYMMKKSYFRIFLYSYLLTMSIPLLLIGTYSYLSSTNHLRARYITKNEVFNNSIIQTLNYQYDQLTQIQTRLIKDRDISRINIKENAVKAMRLKDALGDFSLTNNILKDIILYFDGGDYVFTSVTSCKVNYISKFLAPFSQYTIPIDNLHIDSVDDYLSYIDSTRSVDPLNSLFTYINIDMPFNKTALTMVLNHEKLEKLVEKDLLYEPNAKFVVVNKKGDIVMSNLPDLTLDDLTLLEVASEEITMGDRTYILNAQSTIGGLFTSYSLIDKAYISKQVLSYQHPFIYGIGFCLLLSLLVIYYWMHKLYKPILNLKKYSGSLTPPSCSKQSNELDTIRSTITYLATSNEELAMKISTYSSSSRYNYLHKVIKGYYRTRKDLVENGLKEGIAFDYPNFAVGIVDLKLPFMSESLKTNFKEIVSETLADEDLNLYFYDHLESSKIILLLCCSDDLVKHMKSLLERSQRRIRFSLQTTNTIAFGSCCKEPSQIIRSYMEASTALEYEFVYGENQVYFYEDTDLSSYSNELSPLKKLEKLKHLILIHNEESICNLIHNLEAYVKSTKLPIFMMRGICHEINHLMMDIINELQRYSPSINIEDTTMLLLKDYDSMHDFFDTLEQVSLSLSQAIKKDTLTKEKPVVYQIKDFINVNAMDTMLSLNVISSKFGLSPSQLSQLFKDEMNMTITDYLTELRISHAKERLKKTQDSVKDIASQVGYTNVSSFIRRFKQVTKLTPGQYRELAQEM